LVGLLKTDISGHQQRRWTRERVSEKRESGSSVFDAGENSQALSKFKVMAAIEY
jgi:hypothetical protein